MNATNNKTMTDPIIEPNDDWLADRYYHDLEDDEYDCLDDEEENEESEDETIRLSISHRKRNY